MGDPEVFKMTGFKQGLQPILVKLLLVEFWVVAILVAGSLVEERLLLPGIAIGLGFWFCRWLTTGSLVNRTPADWPIAILVVVADFALVLSNFPEITGVQVLRLFSGILLYYAVCNWVVSLKRLRWVIWGVFLAGLALVAFALVGVEWSVTKELIPTNLYDQMPLLVKDTANPNVMAGALVIFLPISIAMILYDGKGFNKRTRAFAFLITVLMSVIIFLTQSRGAWLASACSIALLVILRWRWGWLVALAGLILAGAALINFGPKSALEALVSTTTVTGVAGRVQIWTSAISMVQDFPLTGIGMGAFAEVAELLYPFSTQNPQLIAHAHNLFIQIAVDLGLPGLITWLATLAVTIVSAFNLFRIQVPGGARNSWTRIMGAGLLGSQLALITNGILDAVTWGMVRPAPLVWLTWGLTMACWNMSLANTKGIATQPVIPTQAMSIKSAV